MRLSGWLAVTIRESSKLRFGTQYLPPRRDAANFQRVVNIARIMDSATPPNLTGEGLVAAAAEAVAVLDGDGYRTGYVMAAGIELYRLLHTRAVGAADLPIVAVRGLLGDGPVHRCTVLEPDEALVLSVGAGRIDRAVAVTPVAEFLRVEQTAPRPPAPPTSFAFGGFMNGSLHASRKPGARSCCAWTRHQSLADAAPQRRRMSLRRDTWPLPGPILGRSDCPVEQGEQG